MDKGWTSETLRESEQARKRERGVADWNQASDHRSVNVDHLWIHRERAPSKMQAACLPSIVLSGRLTTLLGAKFELNCRQVLLTSRDIPMGAMRIRL